MEIWQLTIVCENGPIYDILGDEEMLKAEMKAWQVYSTQDIQGAIEAKESFDDKYIDTEGFEVRIIEGTQRQIAYRFAEVQGMVLSTGSAMQY